MRKRIVISALLALAAGICCFGAKKTTVVVKTVFSDGQKNFWPFVEKRVSSTAKAPTAPGEEMTFTLKDNGYTFTAKAENGLTTNSIAGFRLSSAKGDYLALPNLPGMALTKVAYVVGFTGPTCSPFIETVDGTAIKGGEVKEGKAQAGDILEWNLDGVSPGKQCRISIQKGGNFSIREIELTYTGVVPKAKKVKAPKSKYKIVELDFYNPETGKSNWPFTSKYLSYKANITDADLVTDKLDEFTVKCSDKAFLASTGAFCFGNLKYNYLMLPSFGSKALAKVVLTVGKSGSNGAPAIMKQNSWKVVDGGGAVPSLVADDPHEWNLTGTEAGERYRMVLTRDGNLNIKKLTLYYE